MCLLRYCQCFAGQAPCSTACNCLNCHNTLAHSRERQRAMTGLLVRNPNAFATKFKTE
ncbi:unnamed protein product, partial [Choristocarpus tenellus]